MTLTLWVGVGWESNRLMAQSLVHVDGIVVRTVSSKTSQKGRNKGLKQL